MKSLSSFIGADGINTTLNSVASDHLKDCRSGPACGGCDSPIASDSPPISGIALYMSRCIRSRSTTA